MTRRPHQSKKTSKKKRKRDKSLHLHVRNKKTDKVLHSKDHISQETKEIKKIQHMNTSEKNKPTKASEKQQYTNENEEMMKPQTTQSECTAQPDNCPYVASPLTTKEGGCDHKEGAHCHGSLTGLLVNEEILEYGLIVDPDKKESLKGTSYDLRLGEGHYIYKNKAKDTDKEDFGWVPVYIGDDIEKANENKNCKFKRDDEDQTSILTIPAYSCAFVQLLETVDTRSVIDESNKYVIGRFDLRLGMVQQGIVSQQATQVEPYYCGKLFCYLHNNTKDAVKIKYEDRIATIEFYYVSCRTVCDNTLDKKLKDKFKENAEEKFTGQYCYNGRGIKDVRFFSSGLGERRLPKNAGLHHFNNIEEKCFSHVKTKFGDEIKNHKSLVTRYGIGLTLITIIITIFLAYFPSGKDAYKAAKKNADTTIDSLIKLNTKLQDSLTGFKESIDSIMNDSKNDFEYETSKLLKKRKQDELVLYNASLDSLKRMKEKELLINIDSIITNHLKEIK